MFKNSFKRCLIVCNNVAIIFIKNYLELIKKVVSLLYQNQKTMKNYTVIADSKNHEFSESFVINAKNYKDAQKIGRRQCRHENMILVSVKLRK